MMEHAKWGRVWPVLPTATHNNIGIEYLGQSAEGFRAACYRRFKSGQPLASWGAFFQGGFVPPHECCGYVEFWHEQSDTFIDAVEAEVHAIAEEIGAEVGEWE